MEAEYRALAATSFEVIWIWNLLDELGIFCLGSPTLYCDNLVGGKKGSSGGTHLFQRITLPMALPNISLALISCSFDLRLASPMAPPSCGGMLRILIND
ncbi:hypothetical protein SLEP1_g54148 [Rubroshorea leprosula]|uniref:Uncharacterized protein n=1 Tax=Rubroshorea leprosula TaxID=152421 RepID=A0AAV5MBH3_9ROSI|nr:hypothetical protein SLEP1_g54148 [Rubroshorea leprosula]